MARTGRATLAIIATPALGAGARRFTIDCRHGTTSAMLLPGDQQPLGDVDVVRLLVASHERAEGCRCAGGAVGGSGRR